MGILRRIFRQEEPAQYPLPATTAELLWDAVSTKLPRDVLEDAVTVSEIDGSGNSYLATRARQVLADRAGALSLSPEAGDIAPAFISRISKEEELRNG